MKIQWGVEPP